MNIYKDTMSEALGIRPITDYFPDYDPSDIPEDSFESIYSPTNPGFQWTIETHGPMQDYHPQTWKGDNRTEAQKQASRNHSKRCHEYLVIPTPKGSKMSEAHKNALRVPRPGAGKHNGHAKGESHFAKEILTCPHCKKQGGGGTMKRWHFDNCKQIQMT